MEEIVGHLEEYGDYNARWEYGWCAAPIPASYIM